MTSLTRILAAIHGEPVDRVANLPLIKQFCTRQLGRKYVDYNRDYRVLVDSQIRMYDRWPIDCFNVTGYAYREASDCGLPLIWREDAVPKPSDVLVKKRGNIKSLKWPDPWEGPLMCDRLKAIQLFKKRRPDVAVLGWVEGCYAQALTFRGMEQAMADLALDPDLLRELMDFILPHEISFAKAQAEAGADIIGVGDAAASLVRSQHYVEFILPYERELISAVRKMGVATKLHICGNITHLLKDIRKTGADMIDIDWMVNLSEARHVLGANVCLCGNFDPVTILSQSTPEKVRESCLQCIREAEVPFMLSPGCEIPPDTPAENYAALCEAYEPISKTG